MTYKWTERAICAYYYEQETGKIVADIFRQNFSDEIWSTRVNGDFLGEYISANTAKKAVENKIKQIDDENAELRKTVPKGLVDPKSYYEGYEDGKNAK